MSASVWECADRLKALHNERERLLVDLTRSMRIAEIWPGAFDHGPVKFSGITAWDYGRRPTGPAFIEAWFESGNGERYYLTTAELREFKPDAAIHSTRFAKEAS